MTSFFECPEPEPLFVPGGGPRLNSITISAYRGNDCIMHAAHQHEDKLEIILVTQGEGERLCGWKRFAVRQGDVIIHNAGVLHDENTVHGNTVSYCIQMHGMQLVGRPLNHLLPDGEFPVLHAGDRFGELEALAKVIYTLLRNRPAGYAEASAALCRAYVALIMGLLEERRSGVQPEPDLESDTFLCDRVRAYIDKNYTEPLTLQSISAAMCISPSYLSHIFKRGTGFSPMQYVVHLRLGKAQDLLVWTEEPVTDIAWKAGFETPNNFYKIFVKQVGMSPSRFRKRYRSPDGVDS